MTFSELLNEYTTTVRLTWEGKLKHPNSHVGRSPTFQRELKIKRELLSRFQPTKSSRRKDGDMQHKRPFYEVLGDELYKLHKILVPAEFKTDLVSKVLTLLAILKESEMPAEAAHEIAEKNANLRNLMGRGDVTTWERVDSTLTDLSNRS